MKNPFFVGNFAFWINCLNDFFIFSKISKDFKYKILK